MNIDLPITTEMTPEQRAYALLSMAIGELNRAKTTQRSEQQRRLAIVLTEAEKLQAIMEKFLER